MELFVVPFAVTVVLLVAHFAVIVRNRLYGAK